MPLRRRHILAATLCFLTIIISSLFSQHLYLLGLRESLRFGEAVGITPLPPAPSARLAGQVLGFNFHQSPAWYHLTAMAIGGACALTPAMLVSCIFWHRLAIPNGIALAARRITSIRPRWRIAVALRASLAIVFAATIYALFFRFLGDRIQAACIWLGELLGGQITHLGRVAARNSGPFSGSSWADDVGNALCRSGPHVIISTLASAAGVVLFAILMRRALRHPALAPFCRACGYDLSATPSSKPCPECGHPSHRHSTIAGTPTPGLRTVE